MKHYDAPSYDKNKDASIDICLKCTKEKCTGQCNLNDAIIDKVNKEKNTGDKKDVR